MALSCIVAGINETLFETLRIYRKPHRDARNLNNLSLPLSEFHCHNLRQLTTVAHFHLLFYVIVCYRPTIF